MRTLSAAFVAICLSACGTAPASPTRTPRTPGLPAADAVVAAFAEYPVVAIGEMHGSGAEHAFLRSLIADPRLRGVVTDIAVEFGSARHQRTIDRFVRGDAVDPDRLALVWTDTTQRSGVWDDPIYREFFETVRQLNQRRPADERLRVLLGDPPIDWQRITDMVDCDDTDPTCLDYWIFRRDAHFAAVVQAAVDEGHRVLVIAGSGHILRNPDQPEARGLVDLLDAANPGQIWSLVPVDPAGQAVIAPLVVVAALGALFAPRLPGIGLTVPRYALGVIVALALAGSTFLALRAAPVGFDQRGDELEGLAALARGQSVAFLGVDRFAGYWLRGTLMQSPGGYVPAEVKARPGKVWQQGLAMDLDTLAPKRLDDFDYAITTRAAYQSAPPPNFEPVVRTAAYVLWRRSGATPPLRVIDKDGTPGRILDCASAEGRRLAAQPGVATVRPEPVTGDPGDWSRRNTFDAPGHATQSLELAPGRWRLSLQYHSQVPLTVSARGSEVELPPSLDGMYLTHKGEGAFWPAGRISVRGGDPVRVTVDAPRPSELQRDLGVDRGVWLGTLAATQPGLQRVPMRDACGRYVDHFITFQQ